MKVQPTARSGIHWSGSLRPMPTNSAMTPTTTPASPTRPSRHTVALNRRGRRAPRRRGALGDKATCRCGLDSGPVCGRIPTGDQHDRWRIRDGSQLFRDCQPVEIWELDVEQNDLRPQPGDCPQRARSIGRLTDDIEAFGLEQCCSRGPKGWMVVDDEHRWAHAADRATGRWRAHCG